MYKEDTIGLDTSIIIRSQDDIEDIIGNPPSWILYWGIIIVGGLLALFYLMMAFINYPDKLSAPVILTTENPAIKVFPEERGYVQALFAKDQDTIVKDQSILLIKSDTKWNDILLFKAFLTEIDTASSMLLQNLPNSLYLGNLQNTYTEILETLNEYRYVANNLATATNINQIKNQILSFDNLNKSIRKQTEIFEKEVIIVNNKYETNKKLNVEGAISNQEVELIKQDLLSNQRQLENMQAQVLNNNVNIDQLNVRITELKYAREKKMFETKSKINKLFRKIKNEIAQWERKYLITSPIDGVLSLSKIWSTNQIINSEEIVFTVIPINPSDPIIARAKMPAEGIGKIKIGTKAIIKLKGYPEQEFGILKCKVDKISSIPSMDGNEKSHYNVELVFNEGLITTYNQTIPMQHEMEGQAELITEDKTILQRIINQSYDILKNQ